jgi:adenine-specific DNA-methyltransferase
MEKLKMHSPDLTQKNIAKLTELFPNCVTESNAEDGSLKRAIDFDLLRQELSGSIVEGPQERYQLNWPGKRNALLAANAPVAKTLRPHRGESIDFDKTSNLFIEGENLDALKLLQETLLGKVKMIYIDPPYNTGRDFVYNDDFSVDTIQYMQRSLQRDETGGRLVANTESNGRFHSDWLTMMYSRLRVARNCLRNDGIIFISIDSVEAANLRHILDEIFGASNFIGLLPTIMNLKGNNDAFAFSDTHEFTLVYAKNRNECSVNQLPVDDESVEQWEEDERGLYKRADTLRRTGQDASRERRPNGWFPVFVDSNSKVYVTQDDHPIHHSDTVLWPVNSDGDELSWTWSKRKIHDEPYNLLVIDGRSGKNIYKKQRPALGDIPSSKPKSILYKPEYSSSNGTAEVGELLGKRVFDSPPKPRALIQDLVTLGTDKDSIVMDFFAGSGTTAHAVMAQNAADGGKRKFVLVQIAAECPQDSAAYKAGYLTISEITKQRIRRSGQELIRSIRSGEADLDVGFRVLKIATSNLKDVFYSPDCVDQVDLLDQIDNIKADRTPEDLLFQVLLDWGVDLTLPISEENHSGTKVFFVDKNALAACFDTDVSDGLVKLIASRNPLRAVFRDTSFSSDSAKINVEQIFKLLSPSTELRCI